MLLAGPAAPARAENRSETLCLGLRDVLVLAGRRNTEALVAQERVQQALARNWQAYTAFLPQVTADVSQTRQYRSLQAQGIEIPGQDDDLVGPFSSFEGRIRVTQIVLDAGAFQRLLAVREGDRLSRAQLVKARQDALALTAGLYLEAVRAEDLVLLTRAGAQVSRVRLRLAHRRWRSGQAMLVDVKEGRAAFLEACRRWAESDDAAATAKEDLLTALGYEPDCTLTLDRAKDSEDSPFFRGNTSRSEGTAESPDVTAARQGVRQRVSEERVPWAEYLPRFNVYAEYGPSGEQPSDTDEIYLFGGRVSMPIFEGGQRYYRTREAASRTREQKLRLNQTLQRSEADIRQARRMTQRSLLGLRAAAARSGAAQERERFALRRVQNGSGSPWELAEAEWVRAQANDELRRAQIVCFSTAIRYARASGQLEAWTREISGGTYV